MTECMLVNIDRCSLNDGPGIRTVIFFKGCNLRCIWCHNPETYSFEIQSYEKQGQIKTYGYIMSTDEIQKIIIKDKIYYDNSGGGVTLSGGEALLQIDAVLEIVKFCNNNNISVCIETSGAVPLKNIQKIEKYIDYWLYDYKLTDKSKYKEYIKGNPSLIMSNLKYLISTKRHIILRCPLIHEINDNKEHFTAIAKISKYVDGVEILPYHNLGKDKADKLKITNYFFQENTPEKMKKQWREILKQLNCNNLKKF